MVAASALPLGHEKGPPLASLSVQRVPACYGSGIAGCGGACAAAKMLVTDRRFPFRSRAKSPSIQTLEAD